MLEERIQLRYHCRDDYITASKREFLRRTEVDSKGNKIIMTPDMCISFEVGWRPHGAGTGGGGAHSGNCLQPFLATWETPCGFLHSSPSKSPRENPSLSLGIRLFPI